MCIYTYIYIYCLSYWLLYCLLYGLLLFQLFQSGCPRPAHPAAPTTLNYGLWTRDPGPPSSAFDPGPASPDHPTTILVDMLYIYMCIYIYICILPIVLLVVLPIVLPIDIPIVSKRRPQACPPRSAYDPRLWTLDPRPRPTPQRLRPRTRVA